MIILGIDPGLRTTGFGVIHKQGTKLRYVASGTIKSGEGDLPTRLKVILDGVMELTATYQPDCAAIEQE
jgi:crossover junction endodeoxyribonuclease RuvC